MKKQPEPPEPLVRIAARAGVPVAHVVEVYEERIAMMMEDGSMSEAAAAIAAVSGVLALYDGEVDAK